MGLLAGHRQVPPVLHGILVKYGGFTGFFPVFVLCQLLIKTFAGKEYANAADYSSLKEDLSITNWMV